MTSSRNPLRRAATPLLAALLTAAAFAAITVTAAPTARADGREAGERAIDAHRGEGARAGRTARHRLGGGRVTAVVKDDDDRERYEVHVRRGGRAYEVDLSRGFRVLSVRRDDDGPNHDAGDDHGVHGPTHDVGDDHGVHGPTHDAGDDHGVHGPTHDAGDDHGVHGPTHDAGDDHGRHGAGHP